MKIAKKNKYSITSTGNFIKIYINDVLHISIKYNDIASIQTWKMSNGWYCIEYYLNGLDEPILSEYDNIDKWKSIIKLLDETIK
jgi:hypothetical protein